MFGCLDVWTWGCLDVGMFGCGDVPSFESVQKCASVRKFWNTEGRVRNSMSAVRKSLKINGNYLEEATRIRLDTIGSQRVADPPTPFRFPTYSVSRFARVRVPTLSNAKLVALEDTEVPKYGGQACATLCRLKLETKTQLLEQCLHTPNLPTSKRQNLPTSQPPNLPTSKRQNLQTSQPPNVKTSQRQNVKTSTPLR